MTPEILKVIVDAIFKQLEERFAGKPFILMVVQMLHSVALTLLPALLADVHATVAAQGLKAEALKK